MGGAECDVWLECVLGVATRLDGLLGELTETVGALNAILTGPSDGQAPAVTEVTPA